MYTHAYTHARINLNVFCFYTDYKKVEELNFQGKIENFTKERLAYYNWASPLKELRFSSLW